MRRARAVLGLALALATAGGAGAARNVDAARSQVTATFRQMNVPVEGRFTSFRGAVDFDPRRPYDGRARIEVDTGSFEIGSPEYDEEARGAGWLDAAAHPRAVFQSTSVREREPGRYVARGTLNLKGRSTVLEVPFTARLGKGSRTYEGAFPLSRQAYVIGDPDWDDVLEDTVVVRFRIVTPTP